MNNTDSLRSNIRVKEKRFLPLQYQDPSVLRLIGSQYSQLRARFRATHLLPSPSLSFFFLAQDPDRARGAGQ